MACCVFGVSKFFYWILTFVRMTNRRSHLSQSEAGQNKKEEADEHFALAMKKQDLPRLKRSTEGEGVE